MNRSGHVPIVLASALLASCASEVRIDPRGRGAGAGVGGDDTLTVSTAGAPAAGNAAGNGGAGGAGGATSIASTATASSGGAGAGGEGGARVDCGDGRCEIPETCSICPDDCQVCSEPCGDGVCQDGDEVNCWQDCQPTTSTGPQLCPPAPCEPGGEADATCTDPCVIIVCSVTPSCCEGAWGAACVDAAQLATEAGFCFCDG